MNPREEAAQRKVNRKRSEGAKKGWRSRKRAAKVLANRLKFGPRKRKEERVGE